MAKFEIEAVNPSEQFDIYLDVVDPAIRITYKSLRKYQQEKGVFMKSDRITREWKNRTQEHKRRKY